MRNRLRLKRSPISIAMSMIAIVGAAVVLLAFTLPTDLSSSNISAGSPDSAKVPREALIPVLQPIPTATPVIVGQASSIVIDPNGNVVEQAETGLTAPLAAAQNPLTLPAAGDGSGRGHRSNARLPAVFASLGGIAVLFAGFAFKERRQDMGSLD
jgi:hypothetical protein